MPVDERLASRGDALIAAVHTLHARGATPATSGNFSVRADAERVLVTASGVDKGALTRDDLLVCTLDGVVHGAVSGPARHRPSAETALHLQRYRADATTGAVLHVHTLDATVVSLRAGPVVELRGLELLKALHGVTTHEAVVRVPVFDNTQDIDALAADVDAMGDELRHAYLIRGHGLYTWGPDLTVAMRHVEALDFLLRVVRATSEGR